jgi:phthiodiolone/phenolphthiodiolone dimycocerosates ketoreductase
MVADTYPRGMVDSRDVTIGLSVGTQPPLRRIHTFGRAAQWLGFDVAWTVDHFLGWFPQDMWDSEMSWLADPSKSPHLYFEYQVLLGHLASRLRRVQVGVGVTEAIRRHPVVLAQAFMTLAHIAARPPIMGIGAGERENTEPYGLDFTKPVGRLEEALQIVRMCFESGGPFSFEGEHFQLRDALMDLRAPKDRVPQIWLAAHGDRMLQLTGRYADGWYPTIPMTPAGYEERLGKIRAAATGAGRDAEAIVPAWSTFVVLGRSRLHARQLLGHKAIRFMGILAPDELWRGLGLRHPFGDGFRGLVDFVPQRYERAEIEAALAQVPVEAIADLVLCGTPEDVLKRLGDYVDAGLRHVVLQPASALVSRRDAVYSLRSVVKVLRKLKRTGTAQFDE